MCEISPNIPLSLSFVSVRLSFPVKFCISHLQKEMWNCTKIMHFSKNEAETFWRRQTRSALGCWERSSVGCPGDCFLVGQTWRMTHERADHNEEKASYSDFGIQHDRCNGYCIRLWRDVKLIAIFFKASRPFIDF